MQCSQSLNGDERKLKTEKRIPHCSNFFFSCHFWILTFHLDTVTSRSGCDDQLPFLLSSCYRPGLVQSPLLSHPGPGGDYVRDREAETWSPCGLGQNQSPSVQAAGEKCPGDICGNLQRFLQLGNGKVGTGIPVSCRGHCTCTWDSSGDPQEQELPGPVLGPGLTCGLTLPEQWGSLSHFFSFEACRDSIRQQQ